MQNKRNGYFGMIKKIHHASLAVESIEVAAEFLNKLFDAEFHPEVEIDTPEFSSRFLMPGDNCFEFLEPRASIAL